MGERLGSGTQRDEAGPRRHQAEPRYWCVLPAVRLHRPARTEVLTATAQKYKQYNRLREVLAGKIPPAALESTTSRADSTTHGPQQPRKRTLPELQPQTPSKRHRPAQTPAAAPAPALTPSVDRTAPTPVAAVPTSISPTPQRDGRVLGLFDLLAGTPSRATASLGAGNAAAPAATPSKRSGMADTLVPQAAGPPTTATMAATTTPTTARFATTPRTKRTAQLLFPAPGTTTAAATASPLHERRDAGNISATFKTPTANRISSAKLCATPTSRTPSFLRRRTFPPAAHVAGLSRVDEQGDDENAAAVVDGQNGDGESWSKIGSLRLPRKLGGLARSLSSVVAGLRKMEDEAFGDEEEVLREMEMGMDEGLERAKPVKDAEVEDSQLPVRISPHLGGNESKWPQRERVGLLSGFDDEGLAEREENSSTVQQQPQRTFKKRGQKRTTRLVNMRPTRAKRPAQPIGEDGEDDEHDEDDGVPETQFNTSRRATTASRDANTHDLRLSDEEPASLSDLASFSDSESDLGEQRPKGSSTKPKQTRKPAGTAPKPAAKDGEKEGGVVQRAVRKVKATAHANFKRLKLRNSGARGGPPQGSRFRRRR